MRALEQSAGRGRHGRRWISGKGNLYISMVLRPPCPVRETGRLSILTGLAAGRAVLRFIGAERSFALKWPNDLLLDGAKCGGILLESSLSPGGGLEWVVAGVGINALHAPEEASATGAPAEALLDAFLEEFGALYEHWKTHGFDAVRQGWLALAHRPGEAISVKTGSRIESGAFHGIDEFGNLILRDADLELKTITAGDVYPARN